MKKLLLTFLIAFITALGLNAEVTSTYVHTFASGELSEAAGSEKFNEVTWSWDAMKYLSFDGTKGVQIGAGSKDKYQGTDWTISTTGISGTITAVKVNTSVAKSGGATVKVSVGGTAFKIGNSESKSFTNTEPTDYEFTGSASGKIVITMKSTKVKAMYLKSISVTFTSGGGSSETKELGPIMMGSTEISTVETNPTTAKVKGGGIISFTSANAASISVYTLPYTEGDKPAASEGSPSVTWKAPAAKESEQTVRLKVVSKLGTDIKEAYVTVTVQKKADVSDNFVLITDANDLFDGMELYIVSGTKALSTTQNTNNRGETDVTIENGILTPTSSAQLITLEATNVTDKPWKFNVGDGYLYAASNSKNHLKTSALPSDDNEKATISIENGNATITFQGTNTRNVLKYNSDSNNGKLFSCYTGGQTEVQIYAKKMMTAVAPAAPTFTPDGVDVDLFSTVKIACATEDATLTYKIGDGEAKAYPADGIKMTKAGEVTITAIATKNGLSTETIKTFNVTDNRVEVYVMFDANKYEFTVGEKFVSPVAKAWTYNNGDFVEITDFAETIIYESDNTNVAEVNATTGALTLKAAGTCNITASLKSETYKSDPAHYTLTVNKGLVDGLIKYPVSEFVYTIDSKATLPELVKEPADVDVEYSISHERVVNGVAVYNPATIDEQGNITVNTPGIVTVTATVKADRNKTASYVLEIQSLEEAKIAGTGSATPTGNVYTKVVDDKDYDLYENGHLYAILSYHDGKVYAMTPEDAGSNEGLKAVVIKEGVTGFEEEYTIDNSAVANMLFDFSTLCLTYNDNGTLKYLVSPSVRHMQLTAETPTESQSFAYNSNKEYPYDPVYGKKEASLLIHNSAIFCNPSQLYFNTFSKDNENFNKTLFNCFLYKVGTAMSSASTVKAPVVHITGGNVYYSPDGEWYWGTEDESHKLSFANETDGAKIYYIKSSATPSSANVRAMANSATVTEYSTPFKKRDLDGKKITFWAEKDGQKSAVETLNFNIKTGIENIDVENAEAIEEDGDARYFNLQGLEVKNPGEGIYIRVANGKATKILKK